MLSTISEQEQLVENMVHTYGLFFDAMKTLLKQIEKHCLAHEAQNQRPGTATPMFDSA